MSETSQALASFIKPYSTQAHRLTPDECEEALGQMLSDILVALDSVDDAEHERASNALISLVLIGVRIAWSAAVMKTRP